MSMGIKELIIWLNTHPKCKQWLWFVTLWCVGLLGVTLLALPFKLLILLQR